MATLIRLFIHPVKSMRGIGLTHALADVSGLAFDRIFMITEPDGYVYYRSPVSPDGTVYSFTCA